MNMHMRATLGLVAAMAIALAIIAQFDAATFGTSVTMFGVACVPVLIVLGIVLGGKYPPFLTRMTQPARGLARLAITLTVAATVSATVLLLNIGSIAPPTLVIIFYMILSVVMTFWFCVIWGAWPLRRFVKHPLLLGVAALATGYTAAFVMLSIFFDFGPLAQAPGYVAAQDPSGLFVATSALSFAVTTVATLFAWIQFDFWPVSTSERLRQQPVFGLVASAIILAVAGSVWGIAVLGFGVDPTQFLAFGSVALLFGCLIPLQMYQGKLLAHLKQPRRGLGLLFVAVVLGAVLPQLYLRIMPLVTGDLPGGPAGGYQAENWLASALLAVTFPVMVTISELFEFWPLKRGSDRNETEDADR